MIIESLLDSDLYKFTMMQAVLHNAPSANVEYRLINRQPEVDLRPYVDAINEEIDALCQLWFTKDELAYLSEFNFFKSEFIEFLRIFELNRDFITVVAGEKELEVNIKGPWLHTILFEVPVMAIISEVANTTLYPEPDYAEGRRRLAQKIELIKQSNVSSDYKFCDFGTRRRFSAKWQREVIDTLNQAYPSHFVGTSNVYFAKQFGIKPIGTMGHEYFQAYQALGSRLVDSQKAALQSWADEYRGDLGIALSDTYGTDAFLRDFDLYFCKLFDGVRHDSGDPISWGERMIKHYQANRIDPKNKTLVFGDSLTIDKTLELFSHFHERVGVAFGIGTKLTNDLGYRALQIVIKMTRCNDQPVAKISDEPQKTICDDPSYLYYLKHVFKIPE